MTTITQVNSNKLESAMLIDLKIEDNWYYISSAGQPITWNGHDYIALSSFLNISDIQNVLTATGDEIQLSLSGLGQLERENGDNYYVIAEVLGKKIKGGLLNVYRAFFDYDTQQIDGDPVSRFKGVITNYTIQEDVDTTAAIGSINHTVTVIASSIVGVLDNRYSGRRTNRQDYQIVYSELGNSASDPSMDRVETLFNASFDFGKPYVNKSATTNKSTVADTSDPIDGAWDGA